jgi:hypothetical protein
MSIDQIPPELRQLYEVYEWKHACAILATDFPAEWADILDVLSRFRLRRSWLEVGGGRKSKVSEWIDSELYQRGWEEKQFSTQVVVDEVVLDSPTHNKDPFFDRDLNNFRLLFDLRAISVGVIVTRSDEIQSTVAALGRGASFGASTTHMGRLLPRIRGGSGGGCPLLVFGITNQLYLPEE